MCLQSLSARALAAATLLSFCNLAHADPNTPSPTATVAPTAETAAAQALAPAEGAPGASEGAPSSEQTAAADWLEKAFAGSEMPESVKMLVAISRGSQMGPGEGWFGPGLVRYDWNWLAAAHGSETTPEITQEQFRGSEQDFARLDRNQDGRITANDLDWSDRNPYVQQFNLAIRLFRRINQDDDGRLTRDEFVTLFDQAAAGRDYVTSADLAEMALAGFGATPGARGKGPTSEMLVRGLFRGEIGSLNSGPDLNATAPDFSLKTHDGSQTIRLNDLLGPKPIVLIFGNFTCGPFRATFPLLDELHRRYQDRATFLAVYVREAHPSDGWRMDSNSTVGIDLPQPKNYEQRQAVAQRCQATLKYSMPLVVDEINDPVGNAYSGMPGRFYVIDSDAKVAYKSGRGPFGFKPGEVEQALIMTLLDQQLQLSSAPPVADTKE